MQNFLLKKQVNIKTIHTYLYWIKKFLNWTSQQDFQELIMERKILNYKEYCMKNFSINTQKVIFSALKQFIAFKGINLSFKLPKAPFQFKASIINELEYQNIINNTIYYHNFITIRNQEIIKVLWKTGMRVSEIINLKWQNIQNGYIIIQSKNNKIRTIPHQVNLFNQIKKINKHFKYVFTTKKGNKLSYQTIYSIFKQFKNVSPHTLRHSFATRLIKNGVPIFYVKELLGHSSIDTTMLYVHLDKKEMIKILQEKDWN